MKKTAFAIFAIIISLVAAAFFVFQKNDRPLFSEIDKQQNNMIKNDQQQPDSRMKLTSKLFANFDGYPEAHTCDGIDNNPPLEIANVPGKAKSLVLVLRDPDAVEGIFIHWIVFNIDPDTESIDIDSVPEGATQGKTTNKKIGYVGPCPPDGTHRYIFTLYALDDELHINEGASIEQLNGAMAGHIVATAELTAKYR
jgi:Raf kinase inhibitor-like YbhB/YbcL family protein